MINILGAFEYAVVRRRAPHVVVDVRGGSDVAAVEAEAAESDRAFESIHLRTPTLLSGGLRKSGPEPW